MLPLSVGVIGVVTHTNLSTNNGLQHDIKHDNICRSSQSYKMEKYFDYVFNRHKQKHEPVQKNEKF